MCVENFNLWVYLFVNQCIRFGVIVNFNFFEKILKNILLYQKKITTLGIENKHYLFILIKQLNLV